MTIHEFGRENRDVVVLIHPALVMWDYFEYVIPLLREKYHVIVPALPGYDETAPGDFTSVEEIAASLAEWLDALGIQKIACLYGCSMGGAVVTRFLADRRVTVHAAVIDGGITPYQLPRLVTRLIAARDYLMISMGKLGGVRLLEKVFNTDEYTQEDLNYVAKVLRFVSAKTIWRTFESCNNYDMPKSIETDCEVIEYWYAQAEKKARKWDIDYVKKHFPQASFKVFGAVGHGGLAALQPELLASELERVMRS